MYAYMYILLTSSDEAVGFFFFSLSSVGMDGVADKGAVVDTSGLRVSSSLESNFFLFFAGWSEVELAFLETMDDEAALLFVVVDLVDAVAVVPGNPEVALIDFFGF
jgi:hypothetical protein